MDYKTIDENVIKLTLETLGKVIKQVPLTEKLLSRPPFKFIHDIIKEIIRNNGFLAGLYTDEELSCENIKNKEAKIKFLQKSIDALILITNKPLDQIKPNKIVAGLEPENTNEFLQILGKCVISRKESSVAVRRVLKGEKLGASKLNLSVDQDLSKEDRKSIQKRDSTELPRTNKSAAKHQSTNSTNSNKSATNRIKPSTTANNNRTIITKPTAHTSALRSPVKPSTDDSKLSTTAKKSAITSRKNALSTRTNDRQAKAKAITKPITLKQQLVKRGQERIAKPVTKPATTASNKATEAKKQTNRVNQTSEDLNINRTLTKDELNILQATTNMQGDRAEEDSDANKEEPDLKSQNEDEQINNEQSVDVTTDETVIRTTNETVLLEEANQAVLGKSTENHGSTETLNANRQIDKNTENEDQLKHQHTKPYDHNDGISRKNQRQSTSTKQKSSKQNNKQPVKSAINRVDDNEVNRSSSRRPLVSKQSNEIVNSSEKQPIQRPVTASRPLTARAAPPRAVSRRALREETNNVLEMASLTRPQTVAKQVLVTNLIRESNESPDAEEEDNIIDEKLIKRALTANKEHAALKEAMSKLDGQSDLMSTVPNKSQALDRDETQVLDKGSLVKKLIKSKQDLEGDSEEQLAKVSSANLICSNRDIERLKEHIQTLTKLANPLSKLLDNLQEDVDLMLLEERNWLDEQQRNEQQLLVLREQMDDELKSLHLQISKLDDQIQQEKDAIIVTNVNLLINQAKLKDIVRRMIEN